MLSINTLGRINERWGKTLSKQRTTLTPKQMRKSSPWTQLDWKLVDSFESSNIQQVLEGNKQPLILRQRLLNYEEVELQVVCNNRRLHLCPSLLKLFKVQIQKNFQVSTVVKFGLIPGTAALVISFCETMMLFSPSLSFLFLLNNVDYF